MGRRYKKKYFTSQMDVVGNWENVELTTDYLDYFQYSQSVFLSSVTPLQLKFLPTSEGYFDFEKNNYIYNYSDHLGNTRLSYFYNGSSIEVLEENNYYPFGLKHNGYNALIGNPSYQYKFQEQELQETGFYSFKWRNYMPDIGRFFNIDPLSEKYAYQSHYNFSENRVVDGRELEGLEWTKSTDGKEINNHTVIRNQSSYKGDLVPIAESMKFNFEKTFSIGGAKATYSYEFNQNADPSKEYVTSLVDPIGKEVRLLKDDKGTILGKETTLVGGMLI